MIPRLGEPIVQGKPYRLRPGAYAILPSRHELLVAVQESNPFDVQLPGGGIDPGESAIQALHREVLEETGWTISGPRRLGAFRRFAFIPEYDMWAEKLCHVYLARPVRCVAKPTEPDHFPHWLPIKDAADLLGNAGDRHFLQRYLAMGQPLKSRRTADTSSGI